jgi:hypothetical protein
VFAASLSLWQVCQKYADSDARLNLSERYNGMDQFMREVMRVANEFEMRACLHVNFDEINDVWPYLLEDKFDETCLSVFSPSELAQFDDSDCLRVARELRLPVKLDFGLYGLDKDGLLEHIADRKTHSEAVCLARKLAPGVVFPGAPNSVS